MNLAYQLTRHLSLHLKQWPKRDPKEVEGEIRRLLESGNAWLWPEPGEPVQMELGF